MTEILLTGTLSINTNKQHCVVLVVYIFVVLKSLFCGLVVYIIVTLKISALYGGCISPLNLHCAIIATTKQKVIPIVSVSDGRLDHCAVFRMNRVLLVSRVRNSLSEISQTSVRHVLIL